MSEYRLSPEAEAELDVIWTRIANESGSVDIATRVVESITERFWLLARHPHWDDGVTRTCNPAFVAFPLKTMSSSTASRSTTWS